MNKFLELALPCVQQLVPYVPGKSVEELQRELGLTHIVKLASNENPFGMSNKVIDALQANLAELTRYPDGSGYNLRNALSKKLGIAADQITLGNGSSEILELVLRSFVSSEHEVVFSQHAFALYPILTQAIGAKSKVAPAKQFGHDLNAIFNLIGSATRLVFIANPNNPTGTYLSNLELEAFFARLPAHVICVLDEAYFDFAPHDKQINSLDWPKKYPNVIIARTFSKAYGLAGFRIGYGISSPEIADVLNRVRAPFNNNQLALIAAEAALSDTEYLETTVIQNQQGMQQLEQGFQMLGLEWIPSAGNFITVDLKTTAQPLFEALLTKGVIVRPIANYEMPLHLRVSIGTAEENQFFLNALQQVL